LFHKVFRLPVAQLSALGGTMRTPITNVIILGFAIAAITLVNTGCTSENVLYNKDRKVVANVWAGDIGDGKGTFPCDGSIEVNYRGDFYGIYFKTGVASPREFYFTTARHYGYDKLPLKIIEARGVVQMMGERQVVFDVEYRDDSGKWTKLPFNGRHKIDQVWPDDIPKTPNISL
jgi:hypothetical protein